MHRIAIACLSAVALAAAGQGQQKPAFELVLRPQALVRGAEVTVADLAEVLPAGREALAIGQATFGRAPGLGHARAVGRTELLQALLQAGHPADAFAVRGAQECTVQALFTELPAQDIAAAAAAVLDAVLRAEPGADVETEAVSRVEHVQAPPGRRSLDLKARVRGGQAGASVAVVDVDILVDDKVWRTLPVQYRLHRYQQVLKTTAALRAGTPLGPENLVPSRERQGSVAGFRFTDLAQVAGLVARRDLQAGTLLGQGDVAPPALIRRGEMVTVVVTRGRVKVTARALANHDAAQGEPVTCTNPSSRAQISGIAAAPGTVVVPSERGR